MPTHGIVPDVGVMNAFSDRLDQRASELYGSLYKLADATATRGPTYASTPSGPVPVESMSPNKWKQTLKDLPVVILTGGIGYGVGKTLAEVVGERIARNVASGAPRPEWLKYVPVGTALLSVLGAYSSSMVREGLKRRREASEHEHAQRT